MATDIWVGPSSGGSWGTSADWSQGQPPTPGDAVTIHNATIDLTGTYVAREFTLDGGNLLVGRFQPASLTVNGATITGDIQARSQGNITFYGQINGGGEIDVESDSGSGYNVTLAGGSINGFLIDVASDTGLLIADGANQRLYQTTLTDAESALTIGTNSTLRLDDSTLSSEGFSGPIEFETGGTLSVNNSDISGAMIGGLGNGGNSIDLRNVVFARLKSESLAEFPGEDILTLNWNQTSVSLELAGQYASNFTTSAPPPGYNGFVLSSDHTGANPGTIITYVHT